MITNISTLLFWDKEKEVVYVPTDEKSEKKIKKKERVAKIGTEEILYEDWIDSLAKTYGKKHLKEMIDKELVKQLAEDKDIHISEKLIDREISYLITMQGIMDESELEKEMDKWQEEVLHRYRLEELLVGDITIPEEDINHHYNIYKNQYDFAASIQLSHIVVDGFDEAKKIIDELDTGASFHLLAQEYSIDEETNKNGGYLGFYTKVSQFIPNKYFEIAEDMDEYSYSEPFQTDHGVAIIYLHQNLPSINFSYEEIKEHIKNELALYDLEQSLSTDSLWEQSEIEWIYEE